MEDLKLGVAVLAVAAVIALSIIFLSISGA
jgi:hypothetical protein